MSFIFLILSIAQMLQKRVIWWLNPGMGIKTNMYLHSYYTTKSWLNLDRYNSLLTYQSFCIKMKKKTWNVNTQPLLCGGQIIVMSISNPKQDLHNINAHTKWVDNSVNNWQNLPISNSILQYQCIDHLETKIQMDGWTDRQQTEECLIWNHNTPPLSCGRV